MLRAIRTRPRVELLGLAALSACSSDLITRGGVVIPRVTQVVLSIGSATIDPGDSLVLRVVLIDAYGDTVDRQVTWASYDTTVARVGPTGVVRALASGRANIVATREDVSDTARLAVAQHWVQVSAGGYHACGINTSGDAFCWGLNSTGQLGTGDTVNRTRPTKVLGGVQYVSVSAGSAHTCAITAAGVAYCWGSGSYGQLGVGDTLPRLTPTRVPGGLIFDSVSAGGRHTCALVGPDQTVYCWGGNVVGQVGDSTTTERPTPVPAFGSLSLASLSAGDWNYGQLGDSMSIATGVGYRPDPAPVYDQRAFAQLSAADHGYTCAVTPDGTAYCWGHNDTGQLGRGPHQLIDPTIGPVSGGLTFGMVNDGALSTCALSKADSAAYCWGGGVLGDGVTIESDAPVRVAGGLRFAGLSTGGGDFSCGRTTQGRIYCWGWNSRGEVGTGDLTPKLVPVRLAEP